MPWSCRRHRDSSSEHPDLRAARTLTGVLNKLSSNNTARLHETLRRLPVKSEHGLYILVDTVCRRAVAEASELSRCADVCAVLAGIQVSFLSWSSRVRQTDENID